MGKWTWPDGATGVLIGEVVFLIALAAGVLYLLKKSGYLERFKDKGTEKRLDKYAETMTDPRHVEQTNPKAQAKETQRLVPAASESHPGYRGISHGTDHQTSPRTSDALGMGCHRHRRFTYGKVCDTGDSGDEEPLVELPVHPVAAPPAPRVSTTPNFDDIFESEFFEEGTN